MDINVIGGSGFIGTRLCAKLEQGKNYSSMRIVDKVISKKYPKISVVGDVREKDALDLAISTGAVIINLAAEHRDDVKPTSLYDDVNVGGAKNICDIARRKNVTKIIFTSSVAVYGFAPIGTDENGVIAPFNDYGRTKYAAEQVFREWQAEEPEKRCLVIIRPTVVFGEQNRGNVYNLLRQMASGRFVMIGDGENRKSMAYVENVVSFIEYSLNFPAGVHVYNYIDKPDFSMNDLIVSVKRILGKPEKIGIRLPYVAGYMIGKGFDLVSLVTKKQFTVSSIRVKKFCSNSVFGTSVEQTGFIRPVPLKVALEQTVKHEFVNANCEDQVFYTE